MNLFWRHISRTRVRKAILFLAACFAWAGWPGSALLAQSPTEYEVKAAFLYNFAKFVEWPADTFADAGSPIVIGVVGDSSFRELLANAVQYKSAQGRSLVVKEWKPGEYNLPCQILFVPGDRRKSAPEILRGIRGTAALTVSESEGFARQGGMINFILSENKVRFEINHKNAESAGLKISSKLLTLATTVWE